MTLSDCVVVLDEAQNCTLHELDSVFTRLGENCRVVFSVDYSQTDFVRDADKRGLGEFMRVLDAMGPWFQHVEFGEDDVVRSKIVKDYLITKRRLGVST